MRRLKVTNKYNSFLSYAHADYDRAPPPPSARLLFEALERRGWSIMWDRKLKSGEKVHRVIPELIEQSGCVVVAWRDDDPTGRHSWSRDHRYRFCAVPAEGVCHD